MSRTCVTLTLIQLACNTSLQLPHPIVHRAVSPVPRPFVLRQLQESWLLTYRLLTYNLYSAARHGAIGLRYAPRIRMCGATLGSADCPFLRCPYLVMLCQWSLAPPIRASRDLSFSAIYIASLTLLGSKLVHKLNCRFNPHMAVLYP